MYLSIGRGGGEWRWRAVSEGMPTTEENDKYDRLQSAKFSEKARPLRRPEGREDDGRLCAGEQEVKTRRKKQKSRYSTKKATCTHRGKKTTKERQRRWKSETEKTKQNLRSPASKETNTTTEEPRRALLSVFMTRDKEEKKERRKKKPA